MDLRNRRYGNPNVDGNVSDDNNDEEVDDQVPLIKETSTDNDTKGK